MTTDQVQIFGLLFFVFVFLIWGRWRYDLVAFVALIAAVVMGIVPTNEAFSGFGHPATIIIALVLIVSKGLSNSGAIELIAKQVSRYAISLQAHIAAMSGIAAALSAVMNNVAALAMLMPVDIQAAIKAKRSPSLTLMPLSFASILGGMITLIGTPPNIIIAEFRQSSMGESFGMFDFAPVGLACAVVGVLFVALIGWRLLPESRVSHDSAQELLDVSGYIAELHVPEKSPAIGQRVKDLDEISDENDVAIVGLVRRGKRQPGQARNVEIRKGDVLVVDASPESMDKFVGALKLDYSSKSKDISPLSNRGHVAVGSGRPRMVQGLKAEPLIRCACNIGMESHCWVFLDRASSFVIACVTCRSKKAMCCCCTVRLTCWREISYWLGALPLAGRSVDLIQRHKAWLAVGLFAAAIASASFGLLYLPIALAAVVAAYIMFNIVPARHVYDSIEWPVIVLLGCMIPIGGALETTGSTALIAETITTLSAGYSPVVVLATVDGSNDDAVRRDEQYRNSRYCRSYCRRHCQPPRRQC